MRQRLQRIGAFLPLFVVLVVLGGCPGQESRAEDPGSEEAEEQDDRAPVEVAVLQRGPIETVLRFTADLEAERSVPVYARAPHRVTSLAVEEGDEVRRGEVLATLEREAQANALAKVEGQLAKARRDFERQERLFEQELISQETFNQTTYELEQLEIALEDARRELSYTRVEAPIAGTVTRRLVNVGDQVTVNQHLFDIVDFDSLVVRVFVPERQMSRVRVGQPARLRAPSLPARRVEGEVERIAPVVDPQTGTVKVTVDVPREPGLRPGMFLDVALVVAVDDEALLVPKRALVLEDDRSFVFRVTGEETVERLGIDPVLEDARAVAVDGSTLAVGDRLVVAGQAGLKPGDEVRIVGDSEPGEERGSEVADSEGPERRGTETGE
ncbi:MAG: efflux RND transporter periplasmic adaptor subunit [Thermoanaerobaculia bacterium]|nr:efflux RND transporter periplasmic adaptor subunit [Thermoanaerobaculia bacterium]